MSDTILLIGSNPLERGKRSTDTAARQTSRSQTYSGSDRLALKMLIAVMAIMCMLLLIPGKSQAQTQAQASSETGVAAQPATLLLLRHALAPGGGDPANFTLGDCSTQRNLNETGRQQSRAIGQAMLAIDYIPSRIWTSQWCRSTETAELIAQTLREAGHDVKVEPLPLLNSTFRNRGAAASQTRALREYIESLDPASGPYLMVAHQVIISDLSGMWANSGHGVWLDLTNQSASDWNTVPANTDKLALPRFAGAGAKIGQ